MSGLKYNHHKLLTKAEEQELAQQIEKGSTHARDKLITHNIRLALSIANQYRKSGFNMEDLSQEANVGLIKAVDRFDWTKGFRFSTYACWWIKQSIRRYLSAQGHVKFPAGSRNTIYKINKARSEYEEEFGITPDDAEVATLLGMTADAVSSLRIGMQWPINIDAPVGGQEGRTYREVIPDNDLLSPDDALDQRTMISLIKSSLDSLTAQEERVLRLRFGIAEEEEDHENFPISKNQIKTIKNK